MAVSDNATLLVSHAGLFAAPRETLAAAAAFAEIPADDAAIARFQASGIKPALFRAHPPAPVTDAAKGGWTQAAQALFADLTRADLPRVLPRAEARVIAAAQHQITALHQGLPAVQASISRMQAVEARRQESIGTLNQLIHSLAPLAARAQPAALSDAIDRATALAESSDIARVSFAFALALGRLYLFAGRRAEGLAWLDRIRPEFGHINAFVLLERKLADLPAGTT
jgi:hypothetical protein